jgi:hypothetical protein
LFLFCYPTFFYLTIFCFFKVPRCSSCSSAPLKSWLRHSQPRRKPSRDNNNSSPGASATAAASGGGRGQQPRGLSRPSPSGQQQQHLATRCNRSEFYWPGFGHTLWRPRIGKLQFLIKKKFNFFFNFWSLKPWIRIGSGSGLVSSLRRWIRSGSNEYGSETLLLAVVWIRIQPFAFVRIRIRLFTFYADPDPAPPRLLL